MYSRRSDCNESEAIVGVNRTDTAPKDNDRTVDTISSDMTAIRAQLPSALMIELSLLSGKINELGEAASDTLAFAYSKLVDHKCTLVVAAMALLSLAVVQAYPSTHLQPQPHHIECNDKLPPTNHSKSASTCIVYRLGGICAENLTVPA